MRILEKDVIEGFSKVSDGDRSGNFEVVSTGSGSSLDEGSERESSMI